MSRCAISRRGQSRFNEHEHVLDVRWS